MPIYSGPDNTWRKGPNDWKNFLPIIGWSIYYVDGSTFDSDQGTWEEAPADGVGILMVYHGNRYKTSISGYDEYCLLDETETKLGAMLGTEINNDMWGDFCDTVMKDTWEPN